jgi:hypothetical protein
MQTIRSIHNVTGPTLTIPVPRDFAGKRVEVLVSPLPPSSEAASELEGQYAAYLLPKPPLNAAQEAAFQRDPYPLRGSGGEYTDPFEPAVPPDDWDVYQDDAEGDPHDPA